MADTHNKSFFGTTVGMILDSSSKTEPSIFLTFIRKKEDTSWEKPSNNEGKKINLNLEEVVWFLEVLHHRTTNWSTVHKFGESSTQISLSWAKDQKEKEKFCIQVNGYKKYLNYAESVIFTKLLEHILDEKIIYSTIPMQRIADNGKTAEIKGNERETQEVEANVEGSMPVVVEEVISPKKKGKKSESSIDTQVVTGVIQGETDKALRISFEDGKVVWFPKSTIHSSYNANSDAQQNFMINSWILKKNELI